jgi:prevent-host-death family protein
MKRPVLSEDLVSVAEFRSNLASWLERVETGRPVVLTNRGKASAVVVSPKMLDDLQAEKEVVHAILSGLQDVENGDLLDDDEVWDDVKAVINRAQG